MPTGYGYGNARLRAMRSLFLTEADYNNLLGKTNVEELITALAETPYKDDIEAALSRTEGIGCVYEALRTNLTGALLKIRQFFEGEPRTLVDLLLRRWDRHNLLTILRGQSQEVSSETVLSVIVPVGQLDQVALRELARQPSLRAVIELMTIWHLPYAGALRRVQARTDITPNLDQLELALNRFHYTSILASLEQGNQNHALALEHFQIEIDLVNISVSLRLSRLPNLGLLLRRHYHTDDVSSLLIEPGGYLQPRRLAKLITESDGLAGIVRGLSDTRYGQALDTAWRRYQAGEGNLSVLERELERWQAKHTAAMFTRNPLSIAIPIGYFGTKEVEIANLRLIAQAVALQLKREQVRHDLIIEEVGLNHGTFDGHYHP
jgi:ATP synthase A1 C subunit